ncbi:hypothetical protein BJX66DRAFT_339823 [Aspergillus keveii]|uniref:NAD-dependent epimerase/dehydratase domain-containing protein n=1 Tax=Aspergillus keveii TaxID=714993 RepID=A0ABR4G041_9EURO
MSASTPFNKVLVTGANSFYAAAIMEKLAEKGVMIHAAVRSPTSKPHLEAQFRTSIKVFIVLDITAPAAFDEAIVGCDAVFHIASPSRYEFTDAKRDMLEPAIQGALSALKAATTEPSVCRIVFTSSVAACINPVHPTGFHRPGYFPPVYAASKALAENTAWEFMEAAPRSFDLVCINPCHTWGAYKQHVPSPAKMNATNSDLARLMDGVESTLPPTIMPWMTDIDEVAQTHVNALYNPSASGRYIIANSPYDFQQVVDLMHVHLADSECTGRVPRGKPGARAIGEHFVLDNRRSREELGVVYRPWGQSVIDFCTQYAADRERWANSGGAEA